MRRTVCKKRRIPPIIITILVKVHVVASTTKLTGKQYAQRQWHFERLQVMRHVWKEVQYAAAREIH